MKHTIDLTLPRNAFSPRDVARAGDLWRVFQDAAILGSSRVGWPPARYRAAGSGFIVRSMTVVHQREVIYGEDLQAVTWVSAFRRRMFTPRQISLQVAGEVVATATQDWIHVKDEVLQGGGLSVVRAAPELAEAFEVVPEGPLAVFPSVVAEEHPSGVHSFGFEVWHTDMDPLDHVNHPLYLDWCDEGTSRAMVAAGVDPHRLVARAGQITWKRGISGGEAVTVRTRLEGTMADGAAVLAHEVVVGTEAPVVAATARTVRELADAPGGLAKMWRSSVGTAG